MIHTYKMNASSPARLATPEVADGLAVSRRVAGKMQERCIEPMLIDLILSEQGSTLEVSV